MNRKFLNQFVNPLFILNWTKFQPWPKDHFELPQLQAHRGFWVEGAGENSKNSFLEARAKGFQICELDVQLTKDLVPVVFHDSNLKRICGIDKKVSDCNLVEFQKLTGSSTLSEVLQAAELTPYFNVEVKSISFLNDSLTLAVIKVIKQLGAEQRVFVSSFNPWCLLTFKRLLPQVPRALLVTHEPALWNRFYLKHMLFAPLIEPHILNLDDRMLSSKVLQKLIQENIPLAVWTVNDDNRAKYLLNAGVKSVITDRCLPQR